MSVEDLERAIALRSEIKKNRYSSYERCPFCGSYNVRRRGTRWSQYSGTLKQIWECKACGKRFTGKVIKKL